MLQQSFVLLKGVKQATERRIWQQQISSWQDFLVSSKVKGFSAARKENYDWRLQEAKKKLRQEDAEFFAKVLPFGEQWRLWQDFKGEAVFLDIETTGYYGSITVVGLYDGIETKTMVYGFNMDKKLLQKELAKYKLIVTFNGSSFDLPVIKRYFNITPRQPHIDLRHVCSRIGLTGGLKAIEKEVGLRRREEVDGLTGEDAVILWRQWRETGDRDYLEKLVMYNEEDIINLKPLAEMAVGRLWQKTKEYHSCPFNHSTYFITK